jgi:hypothetical protein
VVGAETVEGPDELLQERHAGGRQSLPCQAARR